MLPCRMRAALAFTSLVVAGCSAGSAQTMNDTALHAGPPSRRAEASSAVPKDAGAAAGPRRGRIPLGGAREAALDFAIEPIPGGRSLLFVSQLADERASWARLFDGATGRLGPTLRFVDEHVYGAFDAGEGRYAVLSSRRSGDKSACAPGDAGAWGCLCISLLRSSEADNPEARGCADVSPSTVVAVGDRLALLELTPAPTATPKKGAAPGKAGSAKKAAPKAQKKASPKKGKGKSAPSKKKKGKGKKKHTSGQSRPSPKTPLDLRVRWASMKGEFEAEAKPTGLRFTPPLDGMGLIDARARGDGIDLLWYEPAPKHRGKSRLGGAQIMAGSLRGDGSLDRKSQVAVVQGDLEYGYLRDHQKPRLFGDGASSAYVGLDAKGQCEAVRVFPSLAKLAPPAALCALDPDGAASGASLGKDAEMALEKLLAEAPARMAGQAAREPGRELGRAVWAGERGYFASGGKLRSVSHRGDDARDEPLPFKALRSRIAWGTFERDGEGVAVVDGQVMHVRPSGAVESAVLPEALGPLRALVVAAEEGESDRQKGARIGDTWWIARGDVVRVWPTVEAPPGLRGAAPADAAALVGGRDKGFLIEVAGEALRARAVEASGSVGSLGDAVSSPVRAGFAAAERGGGGALIAGVSAQDASKVVAFAIDAEGHVGTAHELPLPIEEGAFGVRLTPLPGGGGYVSDLARRTVVWIDDEGNPLGSEAWPVEESEAACVDGRPARRRAPAVEPGSFVEVSELGAPGTCVRGEVMWTREGTLAWFGSTTHGASAVAEAVIVKAGTPVLSTEAPRAVGAAASLGKATAAACPGDMVSVGGRFCIDRFEGVVVDKNSGEALSPDYPTTPGLLDFAYGEWVSARERTGSVHARAFPLPWIARWRFGAKTEPVAVSRYGARPNGYVTGLVAESACAGAGKRLCTLEEFVTACRGEDDTLFPYGDTYEDGVCNVFREDHPAAMLHDNASVGHLDPRLNRVEARGKPLFQTTGQSPRCRSRWGHDAVYDLVGNLDEWVDEEGGAFAGGFYARSTRSGCEALITAHPKGYLDYSTGVRCCRDAAGSPR